MTLFVFPDPRASVKSLLEGAKASRWPMATIQTKFPPKLATGAAPVIQHAWDGTPTSEQQRQMTSVRVTAWTPEGETSDGIALAQLIRAFLLDSGTANVWRFTPGPGPTQGTDKDTGNEFCTFNLTAETRPTAVA